MTVPGNLVAGVNVSSRSISSSSTLPIPAVMQNVNIPWFSEDPAFKFFGLDTTQRFWGWIPGINYDAQGAAASPNIHYQNERNEICGFAL